MATTINVNLKRCECTTGGLNGLPHDAGCPGVPVLIPCPLPPKVEFTVRLGEPSDDRCEEFDIAPGQNEDDTDAMCRCGYPRGDHEALGESARPIRVTCTIGGDGTWEGSEIGKIEIDNEEPATARIMDVWDACRERWAHIRALALGLWVNEPALAPFFAHRDTVFAALAKLAEAEQAAFRAQYVCDAAFPFERYNLSPVSDHRTKPRPSAVRLAAFVSHLVASVGALT